MSFDFKALEIDPSVIVDSTVRALQDSKARGEVIRPTEYDVVSTAYSILNSEIIKTLEAEVLPTFNEALVMYRLFNGEASTGEWAEGLARAFEPIAEPYGAFIDSPHEIAGFIAAGNCSVLSSGSPYNIAVTMAPRILEAEGGVLYAADILAKAGAPLSVLLRAVGVKSENEIVAAERQEYEDRSRATGSRKADEARKEESKAKTVEELIGFVVEELTAGARDLLQSDIYTACDSEEKRGLLSDNLHLLPGYSAKHRAAIESAEPLNEGVKGWIAQRILEKIDQESKAAGALAEFVEEQAPLLAAIVENSERPAEPPVKQKRVKGGKTLTPDTIAISLIRNSSGITDGELCELIAVARPTLAKYTKGLASITLAQDAKDKLLEVIGRNIRELQEAEKILTGGEAPKPEPAPFDFA